MLWASRQIRFINLATHARETFFPDNFPRMSEPAWSSLENRIAFVWFKPAVKRKSLFIANRTKKYITSKLFFNKNEL